MASKICECQLPRMVGSVFFATLLLLAPVFALSQPPTDPLEIAVTTYQAGDFEEASTYFENAMAQGYENFAVHFALGNCYYRLEQYGKARFYFRKALRLSPHDATTLWNLQLTREKIGLELSENHHWSDNLLFLQSRLNDDQNRILIVLATLLSSVLVGLRIRNRAPCSDVLITSCVMVTLLLSAFYSSSQRNSDEELTFCFLSGCGSPIRAIITDDDVSARAGPGETFQIVSVLKDGFDYEILESSDAWIQIRLPNERIAWIPAASQALLD